MTWPCRGKTIFARHETLGLGYGNQFGKRVVQGRLPYCNNAEWCGIELANNPVSNELAEDIFRAFASVCNTQVDVEKTCAAKKRKEPTSFQEVYRIM